MLADDLLLDLILHCYLNFKFASIRELETTCTEKTSIGTEPLSTFLASPSLYHPHTVFFFISTEQIIEFKLLVFIFWLCHDYTTARADPREDEAGYPPKSAEIIHNWKFNSEATSDFFLVPALEPIFSRSESSQSWSRFMGELLIL